METGKVEQPQLVGRDLDIAVAERVMGFRRGTNGTYRHPATPFSAYKVIPPHQLDDLPRYSLSIEAAIQILEKSDGMWSLSRYPEAVNDSGEECSYRTVYSCSLRFGDQLGSIAGCTSAPEAICLAALKAVEHGLTK
jgi:Phage ABA sandwich domain